MTEQGFERVVLRQRAQMGGVGVEREDAEAALRSVRVGNLNAQRRLARSQRRVSCLETLAGVDVETDEADFPAGSFPRTSRITASISTLISRLASWFRGR